MPPIYGKPLILYISVIEPSLGILLAQEDDNNKEWAIYYLSHTLISYEMNYNIIEKDYLAIVFASQSLRHYMLTHTAWLVAKIGPLKYLLSKAALIERLDRLFMILSDFTSSMLNERLSRDKWLLIN